MGDTAHHPEHGTNLSLDYQDVGLPQAHPVHGLLVILRCECSACLCSASEESEEEAGKARGLSPLTPPSFLTDRCPEIYFS